MEEDMGVGQGAGPVQAEWLPDPQTDGSNFRSRGAGLNCCPESRAPCLSPGGSSPRATRSGQMQLWSLFV